MGRQVRSVVGRLGAGCLAVALVSGSLALLPAREALAQPAPAGEDRTVAALAAVRAAAGRLAYKDVRTLAVTALATPGNSRAAMVELYRHLGTAHAVLGDEPAALDAFTRLLAIDPDHHMPAGLPPRVMSPFREAGGFWIDRPKGLTVTLTLPASAPTAVDLRVPVTLDDPLQMAATVRLRYRVRGAATFAAVDAPAVPAPTLTVPAAALPGDGELELYAVAYDVNQGEVSGAGSATSPLVVTIAPPIAVVPDPAVAAELGLGASAPATTVGTSGTADDGVAGDPIYKKWWFWTAIGVVAVGAGGTILYLGSRDSGVDLSVSAR